MKVTKRKVIIGVIVVGIAIGVGVRFKTKDASANAGVMVSTKAVEVKEIEELLSLKAPLEGTESVEVVSKMHSKILSIDVKEGDLVKKGQVLAVLDTSTLNDEISKLNDELELMKIENSQTDADKKISLDLAKAKLQNSLEEDQRNYEFALEKLEDAKKDYENMSALNKAGAASKDELDSAMMKMNEAQNDVDKFNVENGKVVAKDSDLLDISSTELSTSRAARVKKIEIAKKDLQRKKKDLEDCKIKSTIDGTVTRVNCKVGRFADEVDNNTSKPLFVIENIDNLKMMVNVSEYDIDKVAVGQLVKINADILKGEEAEGVVSRISPTGEAKNQSTERVIPIQVDVKTGYDKLIAGINANAKIQVAKADNAKVIPIEALKDNNDGTYCVLRVNAENLLEKVTVVPGIEDALEIQVISEGLNEGDKIVLNPDDTMTEGMSVMVANPEEAETEGTGVMANE
ncbi:MAG: efflux RND transporter periplasmic adaptor subunit [Lachnospiraceae bacterium]|nr:efflux RND transporter periplasmic adaptor subunit [Lachnospiraceae bacterium]